MSEDIAENLEFVSNCNKSEINIPDTDDDELPFA